MFSDVILAWGWWLADVVYRLYVFFKLQTSMMMMMMFFKLPWRDCRCLGGESCRPHSQCT